jgi:hypothetical protein
MPNHIILYHILSVENLAKKHEWANAHNGALLLTSSIGKLSPHIYCLPNLIGGTLFAHKHNSRAIRIELKKGSRIFNYRGSRRDFTIEKYNEIAKNHDLIHSVYDDPGLLWQEYFLVNNEAVSSWTSDLTVIQRDYNKQIQELKEDRFSGNDFFYMEMPVEEQFVAAQVIGRHIGLDVESTSSEKMLSDRYNLACCKLGVLNATMTKKLFFCSPDFIDAVQFITASSRPLDAKHPINLYFMYSSHETKWEDFDSVVDDASTSLKLAISAHQIKPVKPLTIIYERPNFDRTEKSIRFKIGIPVAVGISIPGFNIEPIDLCADIRQEHHGHFGTLEESYKTLLGKSNTRTPRVVQEVYHTFYGARSNRSVVELFLVS